MGENCGFWFPQQQVNWQLSNLNSFTTPGPFPSGQGQENPVPLAMKPVSDVVSMNNTFPIDGCQENSNEPHGWFYCLPRFQQPFSPPLNSVLKEHPAAAREAAAREETINPNGDSRCGPQKRFLVFDQSGDQTTLIFNSGFGTTPVQCFTSKPPGIYNFVGENVVPKGDVNFQSRSNLVDVLDGSHKNDVQSEEMREDTEELNALLYSDDDDDTESIDGDDEVTSTGHSPSTMTSNEKQDWSEEVASSFEPITATISSRKRKLFDCNDEDDDTGYYDSNDVPSSSVKVTKGSVKVNPCQLGNDDDDDAESSCRDGCNQRLCVMGSSSSGMKRMRPEKIRETVNVLRKILPQGKRSKNAVVVIDEAVDYLKWLKLKAKAFGLHSTP